MTTSPPRKPGRLLITGATGGMGRACALRAAVGGYDLLLADLSSDKLEALADDCRQLGVSASCHVLDVTREDDVAGLTGAVTAHGGVDAIIHTVGLSPQMADWRRIIEVDLVHTVALLERLRPLLNKGSCAVCIASMSAYLVPPQPAVEQLLVDPLAKDLFDRLAATGDPGASLTHPGVAYAYAKKALTHYVVAHAGRWGGEGKRLVSISPGLIDTEMGRLEFAAIEDFESMRELIALDRLGDADDIAHTALFLLSPGAGYITGCDILVDGGFVASARGRGLTG